MFSQERTRRDLYFLSHTNPTLEAETSREWSQGDKPIQQCMSGPQSFLLIPAARTTQGTKIHLFHLYPRRNVPSRLCLTSRDMWPPLEVDRGRP